MYPRKLCYEEWKQKHPEVSDDAFDKHWKTLSRGEKAVSEALPSHLIDSHTSLSDQNYMLLVKKAVCYSYNPLLLPFTEIVLLQESNSGQDASA